MLDQLGHRVDPLIPVRDRRDGPPGRVARAEAGRQILDHETREIADPAVLSDGLQGRASPEEQERPAGDTLEAGPLGRDQKGVPATLAMRAERLGGHGNHLVARGGP